MMLLIASDDKPENKALSLECVRRAARRMEKLEKKFPDRKVEDARRERPGSRIFKGQCFQRDGFRHRAFECRSVAKKGDGTRCTGSKSEHRGESQPGSRTFLQSMDQAGEKRSNQCQRAPSQGGNPASRTRPQTGTIVRASKDADGISIRHVQVKDSEQRIESKGSIPLQLWPDMAREIFAVKQDITEHQQRKKAEAGKQARGIRHVSRGI